MLWLSSDRLDGGRCSSLLADALTLRKLKVKVQTRVGAPSDGDVNKYRHVTLITNVYISTSPPRPGPGCMFYMRVSSSPFGHLVLAYNPNNNVCPSSSFFPSLLNLLGVPSDKQRLPSSWWLALPVRFEEQVAGQLHQLIVLNVQNLQQRALHSFRKPLQLVVSCTQLPQTVAAKQPAGVRGTQAVGSAREHQEEEHADPVDARRPADRRPRPS